jgi:hypothetical protein
MALVTRTYDEELLVRFGPGGIQGAHVCAVEEIYDDVTGAVKSGTRLDPRPITLTDSAALQAIGAQINAASLASVTDLQAQLAQLTADKTAADGARDTALSQVQQLQAQLAAVQPAPPASSFIKKWQLNAGLRKDGIYDAVTQYINSLPPSAKDLWDGSAGVDRSSPFLAGFKAQFGKTDADLDDMFARYSAITQEDVLLLAEQEAEASTSTSGVLAWFRSLLGR